MSIPNICPLDNKPRCKGLDCHLYRIDWRTDVAHCLLGYGSTDKHRNYSRPVKDEYAQDSDWRQRVRKAIKNSEKDEEAAMDEASDKKLEEYSVLRRGQAVAFNSDEDSEKDFILVKGKSDSKQSFFIVKDAPKQSDEFDKFEETVKPENLMKSEYPEKPEYSRNLENMRKSEYSKRPEDSRELEDLKNSEYSRIPEDSRKPEYSRKPEDSDEFDIFENLDKFKSDKTVGKPNKTVINDSVQIPTPIKEASQETSFFSKTDEKSDDLKLENLKLEDLFTEIKKYNALSIKVERLEKSLLKYRMEVYALRREKWLSDREKKLSAESAALKKSLKEKEAKRINREKYETWLSDREKKLAAESAALAKSLKEKEAKRINREKYETWLSEKAKRDSELETLLAQRVNEKRLEPRCLDYCSTANENNTEDIDSNPDGVDDLKEIRMLIDEKRKNVKKPKEINNGSDENIKDGNENIEDSIDYKDKISKSFML
ncbi:MAG: hypothetical protein GX362_05990 [Methanosarcinaceae archaeon]|nr:hypothetical protein [Methanosarcinaceae archaeon]